jgi:glycosyltransferase involved in cell wall biosynthesis
MTRRIALVATATAPESAALLAARLRHLREVGWDARLLCRGERWQQSASLQDPDLRSHVDLQGADEPRGLQRRLRALAPDLVHFHSGHAASKGVKVKALPGCRMVVSFRDDGQDLGVADPDLLWRTADLLVFPDRGALERALALGCPPERAQILPPPVLVEPKATNGRVPIAQALRIVSAGALTWEQGFEHSLHAVRLLLNAGVTCEYRIVGDGFHRTAVAFARHQLGLAEHVELVPQGDVEAELRRADVFVDPAVIDTPSRAPLQTAQAAGVPYVATAGAGLCPDAGIVVPRRHPRAIADAVATLARDRDLRARMGQAGRSALAGAATLDDHLAGLVRLYSLTLA